MNSFFSNLFNRLFGRADAAAERIATALEDIADDMEQLRDGVHTRVINTLPIPQQQPTLPAAPADGGDDGDDATASNGTAKVGRRKTKA